MIVSFRNKALEGFFIHGRAAKIAADQRKRLKRRLDVLNAATTPDSMNLPGFDFHKLQGKPDRFAVHMNGPWCVTFEWEGENATQVDYENYH